MRSFPLSGEYRLNRRSANEDLKDLYGGGVGDVLQEMNRDNNIASIPTQDQNDYPVLTLKHRKRSAILKQILKDGGYSDLAREVSVRGR